ncbi:hypothetical protein E4H12_03870 [Candidatus Thorarchaeota archaeon]|nr:MAG: hypothetical protein E4H12_03870 [Candidatus Thorarchaeota archaeon]
MSAKETIPDSEEDVDTGFRFAAKLGGVMKDDKDDTDDLLELYGTSPYVIGLIMTLVTLFLPIGGINFIYNMSNLQPQLYSAFWMISNLTDLWKMFNPDQLLSTIWITIPLCTFNFLYIIQINHFFSNIASRDVALMYGILSMIAPSVITIYLYITYNFPSIIIPIPIQFFVGFILLYKFRDPDYISPWKGYFIDWSWWTRQKYSIDDPEPKVINLTKLLMQHDADWLEGWSDEGYENE